MKNYGRKSSAVKVYRYKRLLRVVCPRRESDLSSCSRYDVYLEWEDGTVSSERLDSLFEDRTEDDLRRLILKTIPADMMLKYYKALLDGELQKDLAVSKLFVERGVWEPLAEEEPPRPTKPPVDEFVEACKRTGISAYPSIYHDFRGMAANIPDHVEHSVPYGFKMSNVVRMGRPHEIFLALVPTGEHKATGKTFELNKEWKCPQKVMTPSDEPWIPKYDPFPRGITVESLLLGNDNHKLLYGVLRALKVTHVAFPRGTEEPVLTNVPGGDSCLEMTEELYYAIVSQDPKALDMLKLLELEGVDAELKMDKFCGKFDRAWRFETPEYVPPRRAVVDSSSEEDPPSEEEEAGGKKKKKRSALAIGFNDKKRRRDGVVLPTPCKRNLANLPPLDEVLNKLDEVKYLCHDVLDLVDVIKSGVERRTQTVEERLVKELKRREEGLKKRCVARQTPLSLGFYY